MKTNYLKSNNDANLLLCAVYSAVSVVWGAVFFSDATNFIHSIASRWDAFSYGSVWFGIIALAAIGAFGFLMTFLAAHYGRKVDFSTSK